MFHAIALQKAYDEEITAPFDNPTERNLFIIQTKRRIERIIETEYLVKVPDFDPFTAADSLQEIEAFFQCKIYCWRTESPTSKWECFRHSPYIENYETVVDIIISHHENFISLENVGLVLGVDEVLPENKRYQRKRWTIFEAASLMKNPDLRNTIEPLRKKVAEFEKLWGRKTVHITDAKEFWQKFQLSLQVWAVSHNSSENLKRVKCFDYPKFPSLIGMV